MEAEGQHRGLPRVRISEPETPYPLPPVPAPEAPRVVEPPETPVPEEILPRQRAMTRKTTGEPEAEGAPNVPEPDLGQAVSSTAASSRQSRLLDGLPSQPAAAAAQAARRTREVQQQYRPVRGQEDAARAHPYQRELLEEDVFAAEEVEPLPPKVASSREPQRDHWQLLLDKGIVRRHHVKWRSHPFSPWEGPRMPVEISNLTCERAVHRRYKDGTMDQEDDDWKSLKPSRRAPGKWKGFTDFFLTKAGLKNLRKNSPSEKQVLESGHYMYEVLSPEVFAAKKASSDEVHEKDTP